jgi:hypothetical protein
MAFSMLDQTIIPYPQDNDIQVDALHTWFDSVITGNNPDAVKQNNYQKTIADKDIYQTSFPLTISTDRMNFQDHTLEEGFDVLALLYTTEIYSEEQRQETKEFNVLADIIMNKELFDLARKFKVVSYDTNVNAFPSGIEFSPKFP